MSKTEVIYNYLICLFCRNLRGMVDILGVVFKRFVSQELSHFEPFSYPTSNTLVVGDENICRSMLFLTTVTAATALGVKVLFFTQSRFQSLPVTLQDPVVSGECLKKIRFVYPSTLDELLEDVASLHTLASEATSLPSLIVVEGLERFIRTPTMQDMPRRDIQASLGHLMALLHDTSSFLTGKGNQDLCRVIVSFCPELEGRDGGDAFAADPLLLVLDRYLQVRCTLDKVRNGEGQNEWMLYLSGLELWMEEEGRREERPGLQWRVVLQSKGALEFWPVSSAKEGSGQGQNPTEGKHD